MQPRVYDADQHHIREPLIDHHALEVLSRLQDAGFVAYLVGGGVRDLLLKRKPKDFDISTSARPEEIKKLFRNCLLIGRRFRLAHIRFGRKIIEVSTFRAGETEEARLIVRDNVWGSPEEDVYRRDFTINGLFYDSSNHQIIDYVDGFQDLGRNLLRTIGDPKTRFHQDPVRMIRALKFQARFGFEIERASLEALPACRGEILKSSSARVIEELLRMLESGAAEPFLRLLAKHRFLELLLPELCEEAESEGLERVYAYLHAVDGWIQELEKYSPQRSVLVSAILYPLVDTCVQEAEEDEGKPCTLGQIHELVSDLIEEMLNGEVLAFPRRIRAVCGFILEAQYRLTPTSQRKVRRQRLVSHPDFRQALELLKLRAVLDPKLLEGYQSWKELFEAEGGDKERPRRRPRRRRRG